MGKKAEKLLAKDGSTVGLATTGGQRYVNPNDKSVRTSGAGLSSVAEDSRLLDLANFYRTPTSESEAFFAERRNRGIGVGLDDDGTLVHALPDGKTAKSSP